MSFSSSGTVVLLVFSVIYSIQALICYESDDNGVVYERTNTTWIYCQFVPFTFSKSGKGRGRRVGIGARDDYTVAYNGVFALNQKNNYYKLMALCIFEKLDLSGFSKLPAEHNFRCFCNYDRCNSAATFANYLENIKSDFNEGKGPKGIDKMPA